MNIEIALPGETLPEEYFDVRYQVLRKPLKSPKGSERIDGDADAIHAWATIDGLIVSVGRAHLIPPDHDGSVFDQKANSACPAFPPLGKEFQSGVDDANMSFPQVCRPAFQIRQMGTLSSQRGKGIASEILAALEAKAQNYWNAKTGWLQARMVAIPFYEANGWTCFDDEYDIPNVGTHRSMWKNFAT